MKIFQPKKLCAGFTLAEVLIAVAIFVIAVFAILQLVNQNMRLVKYMQKNKPDIGALAGKTMMEPVAPDGTLATGPMAPEDENFGGNQGGANALYPEARWERDIVTLDATNGLYLTAIVVREIDSSGEETEYQLRFLMFRPDLAEAERSGNTQ